MSDDLKSAWVARVLGVVIPQPGQGDDEAGAGSKGLDVLATWRDAKDSVDSRLNGLASKLRQYGDPDLDRIADYGLFRIGTGETVALTRSLFDYTGAQPAERSKRSNAVRAAIGSYRVALASNLARLIDENPAGVQIGLRSTMEAALTTIERALQ